MSNLECMPTALGQTAQEGLEDIKVLAKKRRRLKKQRAALGTQGRHGLQKIRQVFVNIGELLIVRDPARRFQHELETVRNLPGPVQKELVSWHPIEGVIDLDGGKLFGVIGQHLRGGQVRWIEIAFPFLVGVATRAGAYFHRSHRLLKREN